MSISFFQPKIVETRRVLRKNNYLNRLNKKSALIKDKNITKLLLYQEPKTFNVRISNFINQTYKNLDINKCFKYSTIMTSNCFISCNLVL